MTKESGRDTIATGEPIEAAKPESENKMKKKGVLNVRAGASGRNMGGDYTLYSMGWCIRCGRDTLAVNVEQDLAGAIRYYEADPRGPSGMRSCSLIEAIHFDMIGPDVVACWDCMDEDAERHRQTVDLARALWTPARCGCAVNAPEADPTRYACPCGDHCPEHGKAAGS